MVKKENKLSWTMLLIPVYLWILYQSITRQISQPLDLMIFYSIFILFLIVGIIAELRKKSRLDLRRESAARRELQEVKERSLPEVNALSLPERIQYLPASSQWSIYLYLSTAFILILEIIFIVNALNPGDKFRDLHIQMAIILPIMGVAFWIGTFLYRSTQSFKVTEDGLTKRTLLSKTTILWKDAHLFAIHARTYNTITFGGTPDGILELASNRKIIHWTIPRFSLPGLLLRKTSFETYEQHMQGLLATIAARTELVCYDLNA